MYESYADVPDAEDAEFKHLTEQLLIGKTVVTLRLAIAERIAEWLQSLGNNRILTVRRGRAYIFGPVEKLYPKEMPQLEKALTDDDYLPMIDEFLRTSAYTLAHGNYSPTEFYLLALIKMKEANMDLARLDYEMQDTCTLFYLKGDKHDDHA